MASLRSAGRVAALLTMVWLSPTALAQDAPWLDGAGLPSAPPIPPGMTAPLRFDSTDVTVRTPTSDVLDRYRADPAFAYDREPPSPSLWERFRAWVKRQLPWLSSPATGRVIEWLIYLTAAGLIIFAILRLLRMEGRGLFYGRSDRSRLAFDEIEDIEAVDFDRLIAEAVQAQDYRRAVRLYYLKALKELTVRDLIVWRRDKTNHDYLRELRASPHRATFSRLTYLFEYIWYGDFAVDEAAFTRAQARFDAFIDAVRTTTPVAPSEPAASA